MTGSTNEAHGKYLELSRIDGADPVVWIEFGTLAWELDDYRRVAQCSVRAIALAPERFEGYMLKGLYERAGQLRRRDRAVPDGECPHRADGAAADAHGPHDGRGGQRERALRAYSNAMQKDPSSPRLARCTTPSRATAWRPCRPTERCDEVLAAGRPRREHRRPPVTVRR